MGMKILKSAKQDFISFDNGNGLVVTFSNYGATIVDIKTKDYDGKISSIILTHKDKKRYIKDYGYLGKTIGPVAGRIAYGRFAINNQKYYIKPYHNKHLLHSGKNSMSFIKYPYSIKEENDKYQIVFTGYLSKKRSMFPSDYNYEIIYTISKNENKLLIEYRAVCDNDSIINMTNHSYFNLSGDLADTIDDELLEISASKYFSLTPEKIPDKLNIVSNGMDFRKAKKIKDAILENGNQYDHFFIFDDKHFLRLYDPKTKRVLEIESNSSGVQIFSLTNNELKTFAIALEFQNMPNGINMPNYNDTSFVRKDSTYYHYISLEFKIDK